MAHASARLWVVLPLAPQEEMCNYPIAAKQAKEK
jgi:hypothetical protein